MGFTKGADAGQKQAQSQNGPRSRVRYLTSETELKKDGDRVVVRPITEASELISVFVHNFIPTKTAPADYKGKWPEKMSAVCQNDKAFKNEDGTWMPGFGDCYICRAPQYKEKDKFNKPISKPRWLGFGLMCLREPVKNETGRVVGYRDQVVEVQTGEDTTEKVRNIVVASMTFSNFWGNLNAYAHEYGTVCDQDFAIRVEGESKDKDYKFIPQGRTEGHEPGTASWDAYIETCEKLGLDLERILTDMASPEHYEKFFIPGPGEEAADTHPAAGTYTDAGKADPAAVQALRDRIGSYGAQKQSAA